MNQNNSKKFIVAAIKPWNIENYKIYCRGNFKLITDRAGLKNGRLEKIKPKYIFFPHWSWIIPEEIWKNYECVVFHMTDLPYGRGGTPLQNLILRGHKKTKISAIKVNGGIDTGDIYMKTPLSLSGSAEEIYRRASKAIFSKMIPAIIKNNPTPRKQSGKAVIFKRRKPEQSRIPDNLDVKEAYDFIRMLDAPGYPRAYLETRKLKIELSKAKIDKKTVKVEAKVYIKK